MKYEVTIGIPVYNVEKYIRLTMDSALAQTFESIEFLILDDCGTDGSMDIVREYKQMHSRGKDIRIVRPPQNGGIGSARNKIIEEAQGRYLYFLDADDTIASNAIELLHKSAVKYNADIVYGSYQRIEEFDGEAKSINYCYPHQLFLSENEFADWAYSNYGFLQATTWNFIIRTDIYRKNNLRYKSISYWEDFAFTIDLPTYVTRAVLLPDITYLYYCRSGSLSNFQQRMSISKDEILATIRAIEDLKNQSGRLFEKPYFPKRMYKLMLTNFYIACAILKNKEIITPAFTKREIRDVMRSPISFVETLKLKRWRMRNLSLYLLGVLPSSFSVILIKLIGKYKGLI
jgi:glycosyltransferase involved in cell wall biosynthesis